jgi:hypothetical protein
VLPLFIPDIKSKKAVVKGEFDCEIIDVINDQTITDGEIV